MKLYRVTSLGKSFSLKEITEAFLKVSDTIAPTDDIPLRVLKSLVKTHVISVMHECQDKGTLVDEYFDRQLVNDFSTKIVNGEVQVLFTKTPAMRSEHWKDSHTQR